MSNYTGSVYVGEYTNKYLYDGWNCVALLGPTLSLSNSFMWGLDLSGSMQGAGGVGGLLGENIVGNGVQFVAFDGNGNVSALVNATAGVTTANYEYGPFGELLRATGPMAKLNPFGWGSEMGDQETDLVYYGHRYYNPSTGRWPNRDPLANGERLIRLRLPRRVGKMPWEMAEGPNVYTYAFNNPVGYFDVNGLWTFGVGVTVSINWGPFNGTVSVGLSGDSQGNLNGWATGGGGVTGAGAGVSAGVSLQASNAKCNKDLGGKFGYAGAGGFFGGGASGDTFWGPSDDGPVVGGGFTVGVGLGAGATGGLSDTGIF